MHHDQVLANLNLFAVLQNLEELLVLDRETASLAKGWNITIQFSVLNGPSAYVAFKNGVCAVGRGESARSDLKLFFLGHGHLNNMFDGKGAPIPVKGFTKLYFLATKFKKLTDRLEYFLKPTDELLADEEYSRINTVMTLNTAAFAAAELIRHEPVSRAVAKGMPDGKVLLKILPDGPAVHLNFQDGDVSARKEDVERPMAQMIMKNMEVAAGFLNQRIDAFSAIAMEDVAIKGQTFMLDKLSLVLDRIPLYLK